MNAIIEPIAMLLGKILDVLFTGLNAIGLGNIAIAIVIFTLVVKLLMLPLTAKQQKMTKLNSVISPEVKAIQDKYKDKKGDQEAMMKMSEETKAVYAKYGTSQMGGCVQLLIQFPILISLYRVFQNIPMYVGILRGYFENILNAISTNADFAVKMNEINSKLSVEDWANADKAVVAMNSFTAEQWEQVKNSFPAFGQLISDNVESITHMNTFFGINVSQIPTLALNIAIIIPILAGVSQFISAKIAQGNQEIDDDNPAAASMKMMTLFMPIMSAFLCFSVPAGLGLYWIATAVFQTIIQLCINAYYDKIGIDAIIKKNVEKRNKKLRKKGIDPDKIAKNATVSTKRIDATEKNKQRIENLQKKKEANDKKVKEILEANNYYKTAKPGSLAEKAGMVAKYNEKNGKNSKN